MPVKWSDTLTTAPTSEPVSIEDAKRNLDLPDSDDSRDAEIKLWIREARAQVEHDARTALMDQTRELRLHTWTDLIDSPFPVYPVDSITSIQYQDGDNAQQTLGTGVYGVDLYRRPARVYLKKDQVWPVLYGGYDDILVTYVAGYGAAADVPPAAKSAIMMLVRHYYDNPDLAVGDGVDMAEVPRGYQAKIVKLSRGAYP